jgi:aminopeptidase N
VPIPIAVGLLDPQGRPLPLVLADESDQATNETTRVLLLENERESFVFTGLSSRPIPSVLRRFSAPVILKIERSDEELAFLMAHDSDSFTRWDASQSLASKVILDLTRKVQRDETLSTPEHFGEAFGKLLADTSLDGSFQSLLITLPTERVLGQQMEICDPDALHTAREFVRRDLAVRHTEKLRTLYQDLSTSQQYSLDQSSINSRRLKNTVLAYLAALDLAETTRLVSDQFRNADNMTDVQGAFWVLVNLAGEERDRAIEDFYERWNSNPLVLDKWFALQAMSKRVDTIQRVIELTSHSDFVLSNPNRVRALVGAFTQNQVRFHQMDGAGYTLLTDFVLKIDGQNPQLAARLTAALNDYRQFDKPRQALMRAQLERISRHDGLSKDVAEIVERALSF